MARAVDHGVPPASWYCAFPLWAAIGPNECHRLWWSPDRWHRWHLLFGVAAVAGMPCQSLPASKRFMLRLLATSLVRRRNHHLPEHTLASDTCEAHADRPCRVGTCPLCERVLFCTTISFAAFGLKAMETQCGSSYCFCSICHRSLAARPRQR